MQTKKNIIYLSHEEGINTLGGSSHSLLNMINSVKSDFHPIVICRNKGAAFKLFVDNGIECYVIRYPKGTINNENKFWKYLVYVPKLFLYYLQLANACYVSRKLFQNRCIEVVHSNSAAIDFGYFLAKKLRAKHVWHLREHLTLGVNLAPIMGFKRFTQLLSNSDCSISITKSISDFYKPKTRKSYIFPDAVRSLSECCIKEKHNYFFFCGRLYDNKGAHIAVEAFCKFIDITGFDYQLILAGPYDSGYKEKLDRIIANKAGKVKFLGYVKNTKDLYSHAKAFLMCSENEGLGRVTIEAMFYGCPVIGRDLSATSEIIVDGYNGLKFNTIDECVSHMITIANHPEIAKNLIINAQKFAVDIYSEETYGDRIKNIYNNL